MLLLITILLSPGGLIYPPSSVNLKFNHGLHASKEIPCTQCHVGINTSVRASDDHRPKESTCGACHTLIGEVDQTSTCSQCHVGYTPELPPGSTSTRQARNWPEKTLPQQPRLVFSHRLHHERGIDCQSCHSVGPNSDRAGMPSMSQCVDCHEANGATTRCGACHVERADGRLRTLFGEQSLLPKTHQQGGFAHVGDFATRHGDIARSDPEQCKTCHTEDQCSRCHTGTIRPLELHPADYIHQHSLDARRDAVACGTCHRQQTFCVTCHARAGLSPRDGPFGFGGRGRAAQFHPPGFVGGSGEAIGPNHHGFEARRHIGSCVGCHQENDCVRCHSQGAPSSLRASPHPPGFTCGPALHNNPRSCMKCHQDLATLRSECR